MAAFRAFAESYTNGRCCWEHLYLCTQSFKRFVQLVPLVVNWTSRCSWGSVPRGEFLWAGHSSLSKTLFPSVTLDFVIFKFLQKRCVFVHCSAVCINQTTFVYCLTSDYNLTQCHITHFIAVTGWRSHFWLVLCQGALWSSYLHNTLGLFDWKLITRYQTN